MTKYSKKLVDEYLNYMKKKHNAVIDENDAYLHLNSLAKLYEWFSDSVKEKK